MTPAPNGARLIAAKALLPIDWSLLPNISNLDPVVVKMVQAYDPENRFLVPYAWGTTGIAYNGALTTKAAPGQPMDTLAAIFDPERLKSLKKCNIAMIDEPTEVVPMVLKYLGLDPASESDADLKLVETHLGKIRRYIRHFKTSQIATELATGELCAAIAYNGDVATAAKAADDAKNGIKISYAVPREGTIVWVDTLAIPAGTKNTADASKLINFLLRPKSAAAFSTSTGYATANAEAKPLLDAALRDNGAVYPTEATKATLFVVPPSNNSGYLKKRTRMWTRFRNARS
jgi:spermidine/putrescine-binding protein